MMTDFLIIARSGRALAASAKRAGYNVCVMDCFADADTIALSESTLQLAYKCSGFVAESLLTQTRAIVARHPGIKIVVGTGFEVNTGLLDALRDLAPVLSNSNNTIATLKDPISLCAVLGRAAVRYPTTSLTRPTDATGWLVKKAGGIGGAHVRWLSQVGNVAADCYYQKYISGIVASAVFLARGPHAEIVGFNRQLQTDQFTDMPFLFQGAVRLNTVAEQHRQDMQAIIDKITQQVSLTGLCGIDYIIDETGEIVVLELNPRPPSTFVLHEQAGSLFEAHLACFGASKVGWPFKEGGKCSAYAIYYANQAVQISNTTTWPAWVKDRPGKDTCVAAEFPVCTVYAEAGTTENAMAVLQQRLIMIDAIVTAQQHAA